MPTELDTLTNWVAVLAVAGAVQTLLLLGGVVAGFIAWRRAMASIEAIEQRCAVLQANDRELQMTESPI